MATLYNLQKRRSPEPEDSPPSFPTKEKTLLLSSRGITYRHRHLLNDFHSLLPNSKKDCKFDSKSKLHHLVEIADLHECSNIVYFEGRKKRDLYVWMAGSCLTAENTGPTVKFHVENIHTMEELNMIGNAIKGSRAILSFDLNFEGSTKYLGVIKEILVNVFSTPKGHKRAKKYIDRTVSFTLADGKIWVRHYQIVEKEDGMSLLEIGPRFVMTPICILEGSFSGPVIFENKEFVRALMKVQKSDRYRGRVEDGVKRKVKKMKTKLEIDPLSNEVLFA
ncbi:Ribosome biogenesis protein brx1 [Neolecta irregularis DAH-3]|uniref:Ribosome biogenesis protein brx1 n=1 Tax=Neolecta irregularis (strain DAH-3) TaxID=1198029 RepID=A0A1U7LPE7_NEOID|nr:Ribosome biogenesis protein brx1 [Neolecta irregularis DAH-3]|eukprot:OLL24527.1 Ribosome biogenesis protein brx1 [Neolecta irregularis DAH-3]